MEVGNGPGSPEAGRDEADPRGGGQIVDVGATLANVARSGPVLLIACDAEGVITLMEGGLPKLIGTSAESLIGRPFLEAFAAHPEIVEEAARLGLGQSLHHVVVPFEGFHLEAWAEPLRDGVGRIVGFAAIVFDVSARVAAEARLSGNAARQSSLAELGRWALAGTDYPSLVEDVVELLERELEADAVHVFESYAEGSLLTLAASRGDVATGVELMSAEPTSSPASFALGTHGTVTSGDLESEERFDVPQLWGEAGIISVIEAPIPGPDMPVGVVGVGSRQSGAFLPEDITFVNAVANILAAAAARTRAEAAVREQALQDPLTGLPNRLLLASHGPAAASTEASREELSSPDATVFVLDLDGFKEINNTLGHAIGDLVLVEVSRRLERLGDPVELAVRLGGDEFAIVCGTVGDEADEEAFARRLLTVIGEPLGARGVNLRLRASVGFASHRGEAEGNLADLLRRAETAMYQAKQERSGVRSYVREDEHSSLSRLALASELAEAIERGELRLNYQPKILIKDGRPTGVEALVRWQHPTRGLLAPDVFIPLAEQTGMIRELTTWVLGRALAECASWQRVGWRLPVAVNLSAVTVHDPALLETVMAAIARSGLKAESVELEITESAVMLDPEGAIATLQELTERGVRFSLDDFGTGYSSLAYLQRLPVSSVKIDKSFIRPLLSDEVARTIVGAVVELGHSLELSVIAEGVDSAEVLDILAGLGCDMVQGFHVAAPMDASALRAWVGKWHAGAPATSAGALRGETAP